MFTHSVGKIYRGQLAYTPTGETDRERERREGEKEGEGVRRKER